MVTDQNLLSKIWFKSTLSVAVFIQGPWDITAIANRNKLYHDRSLCKPVNANLMMKEASSRSSDDFLSLSNEITVL